MANPKDIHVSRITFYVTNPEDTVNSNGSTKREGFIGDLIRGLV